MKLFSLLLSGLSAATLFVSCETVGLEPYSVRPAENPKVDPPRAVAKRYYGTSTDRWNQQNRSWRYHPRRPYLDYSDDYLPGQWNVNRSGPSTSIRFDN